MTRSRPLCAAVTAALLVMGLGGCGDGGRRRFDADVQAQQQRLLDDLGRAVPLLHRAGHDVTAGELRSYLEGPTSSYGVAKPYRTTVLTAGSAGRSSELRLVSYQRYDATAGADESVWGRACAHVVLDETAHTVRSTTTACPASLPATGSSPPDPGSAVLDATTPIELAVAEAIGAGNAAELARVLRHPDTAGTAFGG